MPYTEGLNIHFIHKVGTLVEPEDSLAGPHIFECLFEDHAWLRLVISVKVWVRGWETGYLTADLLGSYSIQQWPPCCYAAFCNCLDKFINVGNPLLHDSQTAVQECADSWPVLSVPL